MISKSTLLIRGVLAPLLLACKGGQKACWCQLMEHTWGEFSVSVVCVRCLLLIRVDVASVYCFMFWFVGTDIICQCETFPLLLCVS
jgi:hypothetical protein